MTKIGILPPTHVYRVMDFEAKTAEPSEIAVWGTVPAVNTVFPPGQLIRLKSKKKPQRCWVGTWWKPWTWRRGWKIQYRFAYTPGGHSNDS